MISGRAKFQVMLICKEIQDAETITTPDGTGYTYRTYLLIILIIITLKQFYLIF